MVLAGQTGRRHSFLLFCLFTHPILDLSGRYFENEQTNFDENWRKCFMGKEHGKTVNFGGSECQRPMSQEGKIGHKNPF